MKRAAVLAALVVAVLGPALAALTVTPADAHNVPTATVVLDVRGDDIEADVLVPLADLQTASGIDLDRDPATTLPARSAAMAAYLRDHVRVAAEGRAWTVQVGELGIVGSNQVASGPFTALSATLTLVPARPADLRRFTLDYDVVMHQVVTDVALVSVRDDWAGGSPEAAREIGTVQVSPVTGTVAPLEVDLGAGSAWRGFVGMVSLGVHHILEGTDHQLFLLTLLLPAPLLAVTGAWSATATPRRAVVRIARITIAFTLGHSVTLALGTLGLPVRQHAVEAMIAVSIVVAAAHAIRPLFPGREAYVAGGFGLVHGMAFSATLTKLHLSGGQLALSLLGFNAGIELMQLAVVVMVLPPLVVLARRPAYGPLRLTAATVTLVAAVGWLLDRVGVPNPVAAGADRIVEIAPYVVGLLWLSAFVALVRSRRPTSPCSLDLRAFARPIGRANTPKASEREVPARTVTARRPSGR